MPHLALAHAVLIRSTPQANAVLHGPAAHIRLDFNSRVDAARSVLSLVTPNRGTVTLPTISAKVPDELDAQIKGLHPGAYTLRWQVLAVDGHITRGEIPFRVE